jgi:hypothetical protein
MLVVLVLALIKGVQTFDEIYAFTGGGPGTATTFIIQYIYEEGFAGRTEALRPRGGGLADGGVRAGDPDPDPALGQPEER